MSELKALKNQVFAIYASMGKTSQSLVKDLVRQYGDLRKISTWKHALASLTKDLITVTPDQFVEIALELALLPDKKEVRSIVTPDQFVEIALELALLPNKRELRISMLTDFDLAMAC